MRVEARRIPAVETTSILDVIGALIMVIVYYALPHNY